MYDHLHAHAVRANYELSIVEANRLLAHMPDREIRPGRASRAKTWVTERRPDRRFAAVRTQFVTQPTFTREV